jgi:hypothetical protein
MSARAALYSTAVGVAALLAAGCGRPAPQPLKVKVTHDGKPVGNCAVRFVPDAEVPDPQGIGFGNTDANGECEVALLMTGDKGLPAGTYKVTFEAWKDKKGKEVPPTAKPSEVEGGVIDRLPEPLKSIGTTPERFTMKSGTTSHEFQLSGK